MTPVLLVERLLHAPEAAAGERRDGAARRRRRRALPSAPTAGAADERGERERGDAKGGEEWGEGRGHRDPRRVECHASGGKSLGRRRPLPALQPVDCDGDDTIITSGHPRIACRNSPSGNARCALPMTAVVAADPPCRLPCRARRLSHSRSSAWRHRPWPPTPRRRCCASSSASPRRASIRSSPPMPPPTAIIAEHLRGDARLRLPRAAGAARAADARSDADGAGQRSDVRLPLEEGHPLHAGPGVQRQAARAHRRRSRVRHQAPARSRGQEPVAVAGRRQDRRRRRGAGEGHQDRPLRLRRADRGPRGRRSLHAADSPRRSRTCGSSTRSRCRTRRPSRARSSRRTGSTSARIRSGTGPYMLGEYKRSAKIVLVANPGYRHATYVPAGPVPPEALPVARGAQGQEAPARRPHRGQRHRGRPGAVARVPEPRGRSARAAAAGIRRRGARRRQVEAGARGEGNPPRDAAAAEHAVDLLQHGGSGRRRLHAGEDRAAPRGQHGLRREGSHPRAAEGARRAGAEPDPAGHRRLRSASSRRRRSSTTPPRRERCSTASATRIATATAIARRPTASRSSLEFWSAPTLIARQARRAAGRRTWMRSASGWCSRKTRRRSCARWRDWARSRCAPTAGTPTIPDAENYMQLLYGPNAGQENQARFQLPEFDALYDRARKLPDSPERTALFDKMTELVHRLRAVAPDRAPVRRPAAAAVGGPLCAAPHQGAGPGNTSTST